MKFKYFVYFFIVVILSMNGCSNKVPLKGKVTFSDDGTPLSYGIVCFVGSDGSLSRGHLNQDGTYVISSTGRNDGLPKGKYKVYLVSAEIVSSDKNGNSTYTPLIAPKYETVDTTDIECEVTSSLRNFDFKVERVKKK
ncbi:MAG: hypothetical protein ACRCUY_05235 [Thermoguttaceae bacterium]